MSRVLQVLPQAYLDNFLLKHKFTDVNKPLLGANLNHNKGKHV